MLDFFDAAERIRHININDKNIELHVTDPYGLWTIHFPKKEKTPSELTGQFTSFDKAERAIQSYFHKLQINESMNLGKASK